MVVNLGWPRPLQGQSGVLPRILSLGRTPDCPCRGRGILNSRPLTYVSSEDLEEPLKESFVVPMVFFKQRLVDFTSLSKKPPHHGAFSRLKFHYWKSILQFLEGSMTFSADLNVCCCKIVGLGNKSLFHGTGIRVPNQTAAFS